MAYPENPTKPQKPFEASFAVVQAGTTLGALFNKPPLDPVDLRILLSHALGLTHVQLVTQSERALDAKEADRVSGLVARRQKGEPIAHITGEREFYGLPFMVTPDVLIPRPETELLVELAIKRLPANGKVLDMGTGSGAIAIAIAHERPDASVTATDISPAALEVARQNAERNLQSVGREVAFYQGSWFEALPAPSRFDVIVSNPPYITKDDPHLSQGDLRFEPPGALTDFGDGLSAFRTLVARALAWLQPNGWLLM
ncbi:MAG: peptide chain release factor N(5)-glutamine methyltransferase, partial [Burkholderiaceae bacterium]|nr:peptide chain release factor N(5)-glutamine methyltransferase [Burkholderiaceae bacterium]